MALRDTFGTIGKGPPLWKWGVSDQLCDPPTKLKVFWPVSNVPYIHFWIYENYQNYQHVLSPSKIFFNLNIFLWRISLPKVVLMLFIIAYESGNEISKSPSCQSLIISSWSSFNQCEASILWGYFGYLAHRIIDFYLTRVHSLAMLVSDWLTDSITHSLDLIDVTVDIPGVTA